MKKVLEYVPTPLLPWGGSCPGWQSSWVAIVLGGSCPGESCPRC